MFYSQARALIADDTYTYDHAHNQVQAIRLMRHEINDEEELRTFITTCRNFDTAQAQLRKLAKAQVQQVSIWKFSLSVKALKFYLVWSKSGKRTTHKNHCSRRFCRPQ